MTGIPWRTVFYNICLALNCLLLFLALFGAQLQVPTGLQVAGRMHPLVLHFPIVLLLLAVVWETAVQTRSNPLSRQAGDVLLLSTALSAVMAALMGLFLSQEGGYDDDTLFWHKWSGVAVSLLAWGWYAGRGFLRQAKLPARLVAATGVAALMIAGHQGATLTHGENYLLAPAGPQDQPEAQVLLEDALVFQHLVRPILAEKCMGCHNATKAKGELVMETEALLLKGGKHGLLWDSTAAQSGLLLQRIHLPGDEKKHMPPKGKAQLTEAEISILYHWIKSGASFSQKVMDLPENDSVRLLAVSHFQTGENTTYSFAAADEATIKRLNNDYRVVYPLAAHSPALGVDFFGINAFQSEYLRELQVIKEQVVSLNLHKMPVRDEDLQAIAIFPNLRILHLSATQITGATLGALKTLQALRQLSLSGTAVKATDLAWLRAMPQLSRLYLWNTAVTAQEVAVWRQQLPNIQIESGFQGDTIVAKLNAPIIAGDRQVFTTSTRVKLKNFIRGAVVRYTLDGSLPDSLTSPVSTGDSLVIDRTCVLSTRTFLPGWISSDVATRSFYQAGLIPDSVVLVHPPNPQYPGLGAKTLINRKIGDTDAKSNRWLGYRETNLEAFLYFRQPVVLSSVSFSTLVNIGGYILPAQQIEVWGGSSAQQLVLLKKLRPPQPAQMGAPAARVGFDCPFAARSIRVLKIVLRPVPKLPAWHPGKGERGWVFLDEVFLN